MRIAIRVDASSQIGSGHFMRCLTLAGALKVQGASIRFVSRQVPERLRNILEAEGHEFVFLKQGPDEATSGSFPHAQRFAASQLADAQDTIAEIGDQTWDWIVVDSYTLGQPWESAMRASAARILVIDDLANREHDCDLLLDQNLVANAQTRYVGKVPVSSILLAGPEFALLQSSYAELHGCIPRREGPIRRIFIFFGGADNDNWTGRSLAAFLSLNRPDIEVDVVVTAGSPHVDTIRDQVRAHLNIHLHSDLPTLAPLMAAADIAIGAGGATSWERLCMGLPALVVTLAENQRPVSDFLNQIGLIRWLGHQNEVSVSVIAKALAEFAVTGIDAAWRERCMDVVDGKGTDRVISAMARLRLDSGSCPDPENESRVD